MKRLASWTIACAALCCAGAAQAQEWGGFYVGGNLGYASGRSSVTTQTTAGTYFANTSTPAISGSGTGSIGLSALGGGVGAGYNWQSGKIVYGLEVDANYLNAKGTRTGGAVYPCCAPTRFSIEQSVNINYVATLRGRVGYARERWLFYGTGGAAFTRLKYNELFTDTFQPNNETGIQGRAKSGWVVGVGAEYAWRDSWTVKAEYQHMDFGGLSGSGGTLSDLTGGGTWTSVFTHTANLRLDVLRVGLNYRF